jgi:hypothetical protein
MSETLENKMPETLAELLSYKGKLNVVIPIIQRDYAQGRVDKGNNKHYTQIREDLLDTLYDALVGDKPAVLDFIYGSLSDGRFIPIDGQQRLTTLFLLHWYLAVKENKLRGADDLSSMLSGFTYEVRESATEFCEKLSQNSITLSKEPSEEIRDASWYHRIYDQDPTVSAMLVMLDAIHKKFKGTPEGTLSRLTSGHSVTFKLLPLEKFGLTDDLFIKMNARGKPLSPFDVFKSKLETRLDKSTQRKEMIENWKDNIDNDWLDAFWGIYGEKKAETCLFNIILAITRLGLSKSGEYKDYYDVSNIDYSSDLNIICDDMLGFLSNMLNRTKDLYNDDLWKKLAENNEKNTYSDRAEFYAKMRYDFVAHPNADEAAYFGRVIKNLITGQRDIQQNNKQFQSKLDSKNLGSFLKGIDELIDLSKASAGIHNALLSKPVIKGLEYLAFEIEKVEYFCQGGVFNKTKFDEICTLEGSDHLCGLIHNVFFDRIFHLNKEKFDELMSADRSLLLRCIQSFSDKPLWRKRYHGSYHFLLIADNYETPYFRYFYGMNKSLFGDFLWTTIDADIQKSIRHFVKTYSLLPYTDGDTMLKGLLESQIQKIQVRKEAYYLSAYNEFYNDAGHCIALNPEHNSYEFRTFKYGSDIRDGTHCNPYYIALDNMLKNRNTKIQIVNYLFCENNDIRGDFILFTNNVKMNMFAENWKVDLQNAAISPESEMMLSNNELPVNDNEDCIRKAYDFISKM